MSETNSMLGEQTSGSSTTTTDTSTETTADAEVATDQSTGTPDTSDSQQKDSQPDTGTADGVPESYSDFSVMEGMELDLSAMEEFKPLAKELNLSQENAQRLVDLAGKMVSKQTEKFQQAFNDDVTARHEAIKTDKEIGGDKLKASTESVNRVLGSLLSQEEKTDLIENYFGRYGDHPVMFKLLARVAGKMSEDTFVSGGAPSPNANPAHIMYPTMRK